MLPIPPIHLFCLENLHLLFFFYCGKIHLTKFTVFIILKCEPAAVSPAAGLHRFPAVHFSFLPPSRLLPARPTPSGTHVVSSGRSPSRAVAARAARSTVWQRKTTSCGEKRRPRDPSRHWGDVAILNRGFTGAQSWPGPSIGFESSVHRFCMLHVWGKYTRS